MESLGIRLKQLRKEKKLTQVELGKRTGVTGVTIGYWEKDLNEPGGKALSQLARTLGTTESYLLYGTDPGLKITQSYREEHEIPLLTLDEATSNLILDGGTSMAKGKRSIATFFDVEEGDFAVIMADDTMVNLSCSPSIPVGSAVIMRPTDKIINGKIHGVLVPDHSGKGFTFTLKKIVADGSALYLVPLNTRYNTTLLTPDCKVVAIARGFQAEL